MIVALINDRMRPGMVLFSVVVLFLCTGIISPKECLEGFSNKGMITVALLFLVSEGIRKSGVLEQFIYRLLPKEKCSVAKGNMHMLPVIAFISAFLNNTPVVVIFAPIIKNWARRTGLSATKFLIPLSYADRRRSLTMQLEPGIWYWITPFAPTVTLETVTFPAVSVIITTICCPAARLVCSIWVWAVDPLAPGVTA